MQIKGISLWSESVDEFVNLEHVPLGAVSFHTEKNPSMPKCIPALIGQMCLGWEQEGKYRKNSPVFWTSAYLLHLHGQTSSFHSNNF